ncbi:MAG: hydantoinase/oxoprolinase family protein [Actinobacteria bacterium]|nr:hydantoinase/oxoprolinase family protein [Actinomycetota bacterium]
MRNLTVSVDIGGTFTDLVAYDAEERQIQTVKVPSTPPRFIEGVMNALGKAGIAAADVGAFKHGSTIATNAIIQRRGAKAGLVTTKGMRDVLGAGRANRPDLFNSNWDPSPALVPRRHILEVAERVDYLGKVMTPLDEDDVLEAARKFRAREIESVAVAYLNSFVNEDHERRTKEILEAELGDDVFVCTSAEVLPELREFERTSTVAANAYLAPVIGRYLDGLVAALRDWGYPGEVFVTHSGGGIMSARAAREVPARICHSGPAGGVIGGKRVGELAGFENVITFDMGGTSADLSLVEKGVPSIASEWRVDWNIPILFPAIDLVAIGAGGGTIAWVDEGGSLRTGPQSAGADPGPACLGKGNEEPTVTDAQLYLGRLNPETYLGGDVEIDVDLAEQAIAKIGEELGLSTPEAADGIIRIANDSMITAARLISVERGYDPRDYALVAGGGAGPLHAVEIARELQMKSVVVPLAAGLTSAVGILSVDLRHDFVRPVLTQAREVDLADLGAKYAQLLEEADQVLEAEKVPEGRRTVELSIDVRYYGQTPYLNLTLDAVPASQEDLQVIVARYNDQYEREFGYRLEEGVSQVEIVNARVAAIGVTDPADVRVPEESGDAAEALVGSRDVYFAEVGDHRSTSIYDRAKLRSGAEVNGPAVIDHDETTVLVPPGATAVVDEHLNLVITVKPAS